MSTHDQLHKAIFQHAGKRRFLRYSLRTMLILVTLCAVCFGWLGMKFREAHREQAIADELCSHGAVWIAYESEEEGSEEKYVFPAWLRGLLGDQTRYAIAVGIIGTDADRWQLQDFHHRFQGTMLDAVDQAESEEERAKRRQAVNKYSSFANVTKRIETAMPVDEVLTLVSQLKRIESVTLTATMLRPSSLAHLAQIPTLRKIAIAGSDSMDRHLLESTLTDAGIQHIGECTNLTHLMLIGIDLMDSEMRHLKPLTRLKHVALVQAPFFHGSGLEYLRGAHDLERLSLSMTGVGDDALRHLSGMRKLRYLSLNYTSVNGNGLKHLRELDRLEELFLDGSPVTDEGLAHLRCHEQLQWLILRRTKITDRGLKHLRHLKNLSKLSLEETSISDAGLVHLKSLRTLRQLDLRDTHISDHGLSHLKSLTNLRYLDLPSENVSQAAADDLKEALPQCGIDYHPPLTLRTK